MPEPSRMFAPASTLRAGLAGFHLPITRRFCPPDDILIACRCGYTLLADYDSGITIEYEGDTRGGHSGGPVSWEATGYTVGVHIGGGCDGGRRQSRCSLILRSASHSI